MNTPELAAGSHTLAEILSQPKCWQGCLHSLEADGQLEKLKRLVDFEAQWLFIGCGSSYYIAQAAAASWIALTGKLKVPEVARLAAYAFVGQLLGLYTGLLKEQNPDAPRNLTRVVLLDDAE